ncbi:type II toxin-antitoxin system RatA family toxin [soil metagenome]
MAVVHKSVLLEYSAEQMFALVNDIENYPKFLPWCGGVGVQQLGDNRLIATLVISYHGIKQKFTTQNTNTPPTLIQMTLSEGPFKHLTGTWSFKPLRANACKIEFDMEYEFSSRILDQVIGPVFSIIANSFVDSFCKRADEIYGGSGAKSAV